MKKRIGLIFSLFLLGLTTACTKTPNPVDTESSTVAENTETTSTPEQSSVQPPLDLSEISQSETSTEESSETMTIEDIETSETESPASTPDERYIDNEAYQNIKKFIYYMQNRDFKDMDEVLNLNNNSVITPEELEVALKESRWAELIGTDGEYVLISFDQRKQNEKTLTFKINNKQYDVTAVVSPDGHWRVDISDMIVSNFQFLVPGDTTVYWGEQELERALFAKRDSENGLLDLYTVTCMPQDITVKYISSAFGEYTADLKPQDIDYAYEMNRELSEEDTAKALEGIKTLWNNMVHDCMSGMEFENFSKTFFDATVPVETRKQVYDEIIEFIGEDKYVTIDMIDISKWDGEFFAISLDRVVTANFTYQNKMQIYLPPKYEKRWNKNGTYYYVEVKQDPQYRTSDKINSHMRIKQLADGSFIIYEMTDINLFIDQ